MARLLSFFAAAAASVQVASAQVAYAEGADPQCAVPVPQTCTGAKTTKDFIVEKMNATVYDMTQRPMCDEGAPTVIEAQFQLQYVNGVDQKLGIQSLSGYFRTWWLDTRLAFPNKTQGGCFDFYTLDGNQALEYMWTPDLYIDNLVKKESDGFANAVLVYPDGRVFRTEQVLIDVKGNMDLGKLPYDEHIAKVVVASYSQDISRLRLMARGGTIGPGVSGIALTAPKMENIMWSFDDDGKDDGFQTAGSVEILFDGSWDYLTMSFAYKRRPKFLLDQVIFPSILFILVSYIQFWVPVAQAPARATLAVIPVLIMLTLSSSVYQSVPEGSQRMWLTDVLQAYTFLCIISALQFGVVQFFLLQENARKKKADGLKGVEAKALLLLKQADGEGKSLEELLKRYEAKPVSADIVAQEGLQDCMTLDAASGGARRRPSADAMAQDIKERDLLFIRYANKIFRMFDRDGSGSLAPSEVRKALFYFNIYVSNRHAASMICMFLRDQGHTTPEEESGAHLSSTQFCRLLIEVGKYQLKPPSRSIVGFFASAPPSKRWDVLARISLPIIVILLQITFHALLPAY